MRRMTHRPILVPALAVLVAQTGCHVCFCGLNPSIETLVNGNLLDSETPGVRKGDSYHVKIKPDSNMLLWAFRYPDNSNNKPSWKDLEEMSNERTEAKKNTWITFPKTPAGIKVRQPVGKETIVFVGTRPGYTEMDFRVEDAKYEACSVDKFAHLCEAKEPPPENKPPDSKYPPRSDIFVQWHIISRHH